MIRWRNQLKQLESAESNSNGTRDKVSYALEVYKFLEYYSTHKHVVQNKEFEIINDAKLIFIDKGCRYQQIAQWHDDYDAIFIDGNLEADFRKSELNIAGLGLHEAVYAVDRLFGVITSNFSRKLVAQAFSLGTNLSVINEHRNDITSYPSGGLLTRFFNGQPLFSNSDKQLVVRITSLAEAIDVPYEISIQELAISRGIPFLETNLRSNKACTLAKRDDYCDIPVKLQTLKQLIITGATKTLPKDEDANQASQKLKFKIELFENGQMIHLDVAIPYVSSNNPGSKKEWVATKQYILAPSYEESMEKSVLNLNLKLESKK